MKISVIGAAGNVGSCVSFTLAIKGLVEELVMMDIRQNVLLNHVMDISTAMIGKQNTIIRAGGYEDLPGTDIVIITAGIHFPANSPVQEKTIQNIRNIHQIAQNIQKFCPEAIVITVTNSSDVMNYAVYLSTLIDRRRVWGYNLNDSTRFRMITAKVLGIKPSRVSGIVGGYHPVTPVLLFSSVKVDGESYFIERPMRRRIDEELRGYLRSFEALNGGRTAGWTTAAGMSVMVQSIRDDSRAIFPCSAILDGEYGYHSISLGIPARIGRQGISEILQYDLPDDERLEMNKVAAVIRNNCALVREELGINSR